MEKKKRVNFIIPYIGNFPNYFQLFLNSCGKNSSFNWTILTDNEEQYRYPDNVKKVYFTWEELQKHIKSKFDFEKNSEYIQFLDKDPYMISFLKNASLRPSCFNCAFKTEDRQADITLADFWGIENVLPQMDDNKGTSLVIVHSEKGKKLFENLSKKIKFFETDFKKSILYNSAMTKSVPKNNIRDSFLREIKDKPFDKTVNKYFREGFYIKIKKIAKRCLIKCKKILIKKDG